jgi:hypothetical protein
MAVCTTVAPVQVLIVENDGDTRKLLTRCLNGMCDFTVSGADGFERRRGGQGDEVGLMLIDISWGGIGR